MPECDRIIMLEKGKIKEIGTYRELIKTKSEFSDFIGEYFQNQESNKEALSTEFNGI